MNREAEETEEPQEDWTPAAYVAMAMIVRGCLMLETLRHWLKFPTKARSKSESS